MALQFRKSHRKTKSNFLKSLGATCVIASFFNFIKKETPTMVSSCEFWETFKKTFFTEHLQTTASTNQLIFTPCHYFADGHYQTTVMISIKPFTTWRWKFHNIRRRFSIAHKICSNLLKNNPELPLRQFFSVSYC